MIDILFNIHACVPQIEYPSEHMIPQSNETVIIHQARTQVTMLGGDQLTIARARSAIKITANGETHQQDWKEYYPLSWIGIQS